MSIGPIVLRKILILAITSSNYNVRLIFKVDVQERLTPPTYFFATSLPLSLHCLVSHSCLSLQRQKTLGVIFFLFHVLQTIVHLVYTYHMVIRSTLTYGIHRKPNSPRSMHQGSHPHHGFLKHGVLSLTGVSTNQQSGQ